MRETNEQKIARLKRKVAELEAKLKESKRQNRQNLRCYKTNVADIDKTHKGEAKLLTDKILELQQSWAAEKAELEEQIRKLKEENQNLRILNSLENKKVERIKEDRRLNALRSEIQADNGSRLEYYNMGLYSGKDHSCFIDPYVLVLKINPYTGALINIYGSMAILDLIQDNPYYIQKKAEVEPYLEAVEESDPDALAFIDGVGRDLYERLYPNFPFDEYSI